MKKLIMSIPLCFYALIASSDSTLEQNLELLVAKLTELNTSLSALREETEVIHKKIEFKNMQERINFLVGLAQKNEFVPIMSGKYIHFGPNFDPGIRTGVDIAEIRGYFYELRDPTKDQEKVRENYEKAKKLLARNYKIHLMPKDDDQMVYCIKEILTAWKANPVLMSDFKFYRGSVGVGEFEQRQEVLPRIVIYPPSGKQNAQEALNRIYNLFKDLEGLNIYPRFNAKVTSLIYAAQGDADYKKDPALNFGEEVFELPKKIYYDPSKIPPEDGEDHYLRHPATNVPIRD